MVSNSNFSEEMYKCLYENSPLPYQSLDVTGKFIIINKAWLDFFGYEKEEEIVGKWFGDFLAHGWEEKFKENFSKFKKDGEAKAVEFKMLRKDGSVVVVEFFGKISHGEDGAFKQTHCIINDVTQQKKFREDLDIKLHELKIFYMLATAALGRDDSEGAKRLCSKINDIGKDIENLEKKEG